jgi:hypothetical protein
MSNDMKLIMENWRKYEAEVLTEETSCVGEACLDEYTVGLFLNDVSKHTGLAQKFVKTMNNVLKKNPNDGKLKAAVRSLGGYAKDKGMGVVIGAGVGGLVGLALGGVGAPATTTAGAAIGQALTDPLGDIVKWGFSKMNKGIEGMVLNSQVPDGEEKTPMQHILDMSDELEALIKGGSQDGDSEIYRQFIDDMTKEFEQIEKRLTADIAALQNQADGDRAINQLRSMPLRNYMDFTLNKRAIHFIKNFGPTKDIEIDHPDF